MNSRNASINSGPNIFGSRAARDCPSPCSPESEPPKLSTTSAARVINSRNLPQSLLGAEVEVDARVHASLPVVSVERAAIAVLGHQRGNRAQIVAQLRRRNGGVFPALLAVRFAGDKNHRAQRRVAHLPNAGGFLRRADARDWRAPARSSRRAPGSLPARALPPLSSRPLPPAENSCPPAVAPDLSAPGPCAA